LVVYDYAGLTAHEPEKVYDYPGEEWRLVYRATGYRYVTVNGQITIEDDQQTNVASGLLLRGGGR
jgi:N-acyl-D-amino-acid deacylase